MVSVPTGSADVVSLYSPGVASGTPAPRFVAPLKNASEPAGVVESAAEMLAVSTTGANWVCVLGLAESAVVVPMAGAWTTKFDTGEVEPPRVPLPEVKTAVYGCVPSAGAVATTEAEPDTTFCVAPTWVAPSKNLTVPVALAGVMVAVSVASPKAIVGEVGVTASAVVELATLG